MKAEEYMVTDVGESGAPNIVMLTKPIYSRDSGVLFSAFCVHSGYAAFTLSFDAACRRFGACTQEREDLLRAFESNHAQIAQLAEKKLHKGNGQRVVLHSSDF
jgi:hypothetical protein